jgi:hypothetical protein
MKLGTLTIDLEEVLKQSIPWMEGDEDVSYPLRMALKALCPEIIGMLEDRMIEEYRKQNPEGESK